MTTTALEILAEKPNTRILDDRERRTPNMIEPHLRQVVGGLLVQDRDFDIEDRGEMQVVTERRPTEAEWQELSFAWKVCKHVKSNGIVISRDLQTIGIGAGQMSRVDAVRLALEKARDGVQGAVLASDAYFPFSDGPQLALEAGVTAIIQPGGSVRDHLTVEAVDQAGGGHGLHQPPPLPPLTERPPDDSGPVRSGEAGSPAHVRLAGDPPSPFEEQFGFSRIVRAGQFVLIGGTTSVGPVRRGHRRHRPTSRRSRSCASSSTSWAGRGWASADVIQTRVYVTDISRPMRWAAPHGDVFGQHRPLMTMVEVSGLIDPRMLVEIEAVAYSRLTGAELGSDRWRGWHHEGSPP